MNLTASFSVHRGDFRLTTALQVAAGQVVAIAGPNGAGKSTLLQTIAGLHRPAAGEIRIGDRLLTRHPDVHVPLHRRRIGWMSQDPMLFPHLDARDNVAYGLRSAGVHRRAARQRAESLLAEVGLDGLAGRRPGELSGGQAARVALVRALATDPDVVLLDEPFAALDVETADAVRSFTAAHLRARGTTAVLVTQDAADAVLLADRIVVIEAGLISHDGEVTDVLATPVTAFAARFAGSNVLTGAAQPGGLELPDGSVLTAPGAPTTGTAAWAFFGSDAVRARPDGAGLRRPVAAVHSSLTGVVVTADVGADALLRAEVPVSTPWLRELRLGTTLCWEIDPASVRLVSVGLVR